jgi:hypothetical protein
MASRFPGPRPGDDHPAVLAANWRTVLAVDLGLGLVVLAMGLVLAVLWHPLPGGAIGALGGTYAVLVAQRWRRWATLRRAAGLDDQGSRPGV